MSVFLCVFDERTDRQAGRQTDRQIDRQTDRERDTEKERELRAGGGGGGDAGRRPQGRAAAQPLHVLRRHRSGAIQLCYIDIVLYR
jgi:hypothetical protein